MFDIKYKLIRRPTGAGLILASLGLRHGQRDFPAGTEPVVWLLRRSPATQVGRTSLNSGSHVAWLWSYAASEVPANAEQRH